MGGWLKEDMHDSKDQSKDDAVLSVIGIVLGIILVFLAVIALAPALIIGIILFAIAVLSKSRKWLNIALIPASIVFIATLYWSGWQELFQFIPITLTLTGIESLIQHAQEFVNSGMAFSVSIATLILNLTLSIFVARIAVAFYELYRGRMVTSKGDQIEEFRQSDSYKKIRKNRLDINNKEQARWRKNAKKYVEKDQKNREVFLGIDERKNLVSMDQKEINTHVLCQGTTGSGKTVAIYSLIETSFINNESIFFIDGKGDVKTVNQFKAIGALYGRKIHVFSESTKLTYNPIKNGNRTSVTDRIMAIFDWSNEFYKNEAENFLQKVVHFIDEYKYTRDIQTVAKFMSKKRLYEVISNDLVKEEVQVTRKVPINTEDSQDDDDILGLNEKKEPQFKEEVETITNNVLSDRGKLFLKMMFDRETLLDEKEEEKLLNQSTDVDEVYRGMQSQLEKLLYSELGSLLQDKEGGIDLFEIMKRKESVIFSFNSGSYSEFIKRLGRFVIADIENNVTRMYEIDDNCYVTGIFDEFGAYGNANIVGIVARARSANFNSVMGIQSFGDLIIGGQNIAQQVIDNNNTFIFGRSNDNDSADKVANVIGTYRDEEVTHQTENLGPSRFHRVDMRSDKGTTRSVDSYHVHPNRIKGFDTGEFAVLRKSAMNLPIEERIKIVYFRNPLEGT